jgi:hypothetical protein
VFPLAPCEERREGTGGRDRFLKYDVLEHQTELYFSVPSCSVFISSHDAQIINCPFSCLKAISMSQNLFHERLKAAYTL